MSGTNRRRRQRSVTAYVSENLLLTSFPTNFQSGCVALGVLNARIRSVRRILENCGSSKSTDNVCQLRMECRRNTCLNVDIASQALRMPWNQLLNTVNAHVLATLPHHARMNWFGATETWSMTL